LIANNHMVSSVVMKVAMHVSVILYQRMFAVSLLMKVITLTLNRSEMTLAAASKRNASRSSNTSKTAKKIFNKSLAYEYFVVYC
jgi:hypothetical protein